MNRKNICCAITATVFILFWSSGDAALRISPQHSQDINRLAKLTHWKPGRDGETLFRVALPPSTADFTYSARLADGRTRKPAHVRFVARPIVQPTVRTRGSTVLSGLTT